MPADLPHAVTYRTEILNCVCSRRLRYVKGIESPDEYFFFMANKIKSLSVHAQIVFQFLDRLAQEKN
jgi:hypothetical protein